MDLETFIEPSALWNPHPSSASPRWDLSSDTEGYLHSVSERERKGERERWSEKERARHDDGGGRKKVDTRYGQRQITLSLTVIVKSSSPQCCKPMHF